MWIPSRIIVGWHILDIYLFAQKRLKTPMTDAERELLLLLARVAMKEGGPLGAIFGTMLVASTYRDDIKQLAERVAAEAKN